MNGLVIAGGKSSRMGQDKAQINYYGKPQYEHVYNMLTPYCKDVFISTNSTQNIMQFPTITDAIKYNNIGPMAALLSAYDFIKTDWLVLAIDYPLIKNMDIQHLIKSTKNATLAGTYFNTNTQFYEPYIGVYKSNIYETLLHEFQNKNYSLQKILTQINATKVFANNANCLQSIDTIKAKNNLEL